MLTDWYPPYSMAELEHAQDIYGLAFPPDLVAMLRDRHPLFHYDWRTDNQQIRQALAWPFEGLLFDVENNRLWPKSWGERPGHPHERAEVLRSVLSTVPKLIPLYGHRYLPAEPNEAGNPVLSVYQADIIYYGANLEHYIERETGRDSVSADWPMIRRIRFWSDFAEGNPYDEGFDTSSR